MLTVLIVEDDLMIADVSEEVLVQGGYAVCGIARTVAEAVALTRQHRPDLAVVDIRLAEDGRGTDAAAQMQKFGRIGILYATGNRSTTALTAADGEACLTKPFRAEDLVRGLEIVAEIVATGHASQPYPAGLVLLAGRRVA